LKAWVVVLLQSILPIHGSASTSPIAPKPVGRCHGMKAKLLTPFFHLPTTKFSSLTSSICGGKNPKKIK
jgi:hypothetical protein